MSELGLWVEWVAKSLTLASGAALGWAMLRRAIDDATFRWNRRQLGRLEYERQRVQLEHDKMRKQITILQPDEHNAFGIAYDGRVYRNLNTLAAYTQEITLAVSPLMEKMDHTLRIVQALAKQMPPSSYHNEQIYSQEGLPLGQEQEGEQEPGGPRWAIYPMADLLGTRVPSIGALIVGARPGPDGLDVVTRSLNDLMHVLCVGASGWGKSTWLRSFLYQVARAPEPCEVAAIDTSGSALNALRGWGKLRYPLARTASDAGAVLAQVAQEIEDRRRLYEQHPRAENLTEYNQASGAGLPPWVIVADESTHLLHHSGIGDPLRDVVQTARQYGVYLLMAGQTAKANVIDSEVRDQFSSRLCFHTSPPSSRTVIDDRAAAALGTKGRALCQLVGTELMELQGPWVSKDDFMAALANGGAKYAMPILEDAPSSPSGADGDQVRQILAMHEAGQSKRAIQRAVFGYEGGAAYAQVNEILARHNGTTGTDTTAIVQKPGENAQVRDNGSSSTGNVDLDGLESFDDPGDGATATRADVDFCDFCARDGDSTPEGVTFATCARCGVACCSDCLAGGLCPDCEGK